MQLVIIGASFAGVRCALVAKEYYPEATVRYWNAKQLSVMCRMH